MDKSQDNIAFKPIQLEKSRFKRAETYFYASMHLWGLSDRMFRGVDSTIYHCCIQKTASQWFSYFWNDPDIRKCTKMRHLNPDENFQLRTKRTQRRAKFLPRRCIISPLFIRRPDYDTLSKGNNYRTFYVMRDPRDVIVSSYFSIRYSHPLNDQIQKMRDRMSSQSKEEGITYLIEVSQEGYFLILDEWIHAPYDERVKLFRYEDLFGDNQLEAFVELMNHLEINISREVLSEVLGRIQFQKISGRETGKEDVRHHYRKGVANDWKNHLTDRHIDLFKSKAGDLLIDLGYEQDADW